VPTLLESREKVRELASKMLLVVEDSKLSDAEKLTKLKDYEPDLTTAQAEVADKEEIERHKAQIFTAAGKPNTDAADAPERGGYKSFGDEFIHSLGYKSLLERGLRGGNWSTGDVELGAKADLTEGTPAAPGGGWPLVTNPPTYVPGMVDIRTAPLTVEALFPHGTTNSPLIRYLVETVVTNAAAAVAEGALKPESALEFDAIDETLHKIATFLPVTDEMLEDWAQIRSYLNARLPLFVMQASEVQILSGDGTGANMVGLLNRPGLAPPIAQGTAPSLASDNAMDAIYRQITAIRWNSFIEPDGIVINPIAWQSVVLSKNSQGAYYANGPFLGVQPERMWGKAIVPTPAIAAQKALVGGFQQGAQVFVKGGITTEASNSHADYFQRNKTAIRAERRLALAVYRPSAFGMVTNLVEVAPTVPVGP
jgi:HK97 family phage major capsid protein